MVGFAIYFFCGDFSPRGFAQKVDPIWNEPVSTGSAGALARSTLNLKSLDAVTVSRCALIAGEGARAPSISLSLSAIPLFGKGRCGRARQYWTSGPGFLRRETRETV